MFKLSQFFNDPERKEDKEKIFNVISTIKSPEEAFEFAQNLSSEGEPWIINQISDFADEYLKLKQNWITICNKTQQSPKTILIVKKVAFGSDFNYDTIKAISEILTRCGWCVRGEEFAECNGGCGKAVFRFQKDRCDNCS